MSKEVTMIEPATTVKSATTIDMQAENKEPLSDSEDNIDDPGLNSIPSEKSAKY